MCLYGTLTCHLLALLHDLGLVVTSYWPLAASAGRGDSGARHRLMELLDAFMSSVDWCGDFMLTSHWVPQFLFMALWLACGRP